MYEDLKACGGDVLAIGGGGRTRASMAAKLLRPPFPILADPDRAVYKAYGFERILYLIQRSATVVVDAEGIVRYARGSANPYGALNPEELMRTVCQRAPAR